METPNLPPETITTDPARTEIVMNIEKTPANEALENLGVATPEGFEEQANPWEEVSDFLGEDGLGDGDPLLDEKLKKEEFNEAEKATRSKPKIESTPPSGKSTLGQLNEIQTSEQTPEQTPENPQLQGETQPEINDIKPNDIER